MSFDPAIQPNPNPYTCQATYSSIRYQVNGTLSISYNNENLLTVPYNANHIHNSYSITRESIDQRLKEIQRLVERSCWRGSQNGTLSPSENPTIQLFLQFQKRTVLVDIFELEHSDTRNEVYRLSTPEENAASDRQNLIARKIIQLRETIWPSSQSDGHGLLKEESDLRNHVIPLIKKKAYELCQANKDNDALNRLNEIYNPSSTTDTERTGFSPRSERPDLDRAQEFIKQAKAIVFQDECQKITQNS